MMTSQFTHIALQIGRHKRSNHSSLSHDTAFYRGGELKTLKKILRCYVPCRGCDFYGKLQLPIAASLLRKIVEVKL